MSINYGRLPAGKIQHNIGNVTIKKFTVPGQASFASLFAGALTIEIGEIGKMTKTKNAADCEGRYNSHTWG
jgi:hypothetical protein